MWNNTVILLFLSHIVRSCEKLAPPQNGAFVGTCNSVYGSVCRIECNEGYELSGSEERKCIVSEYGFMDWSGIASQCVGEKIRLRFIFNNHRDHHNTFLTVLTLSSIYIFLKYILAAQVKIRAIFVWPQNENARTKQKQQTSGKINGYFALTSYCNVIGQSNNPFSILGFSLAGKQRGHVLIFSSTGW